MREKITIDRALSPRIYPKEKVWFHCSHAGGFTNTSTIEFIHSIGCEHQSQPVLSFRPLNSDKLPSTKIINMNLKAIPNTNEIVLAGGFPARDKINKQGAIADYDRAIKINPNDAIAYSNRGVVKSALGDKQGAIADLGKAAELFRQQGQMDDYKDAMGLIAKLKGN
jgi:tetratricopeptide (TPR) repeat protein